MKLNTDIGKFYKYMSILRHNYKFAEERGYDVTTLGKLMWDILQEIWRFMPEEYEEIWDDYESCVEAFNNASKMSKKYLEEI